LTKVLTLHKLWSEFLTILIFSTTLNIKHYFNFFGAILAMSSNIERLLTDSNVPYLLINKTTLKDTKHQDDIVQLRPYNVVRAMLLKNAHGEKIIAISRNDTLLDIQQIDTVFNSKHVALTAKEVEAYLKASKLSAIPALPGLNNLPTIVDKGLLAYATIYLDVGVNQQYIQLEQVNFRELIGNATVSDIASSLRTLDAPSDPATDRTCIEQSLTTFTELRIKQRLEETLEFPPLPATAQKIITLRTNPKADISELTSIVELDASLSAQVVSWAASPYYSAPGSIKSIHDAIVRVLGFDMVLNLGLGLSLGNALKMPQKGPHGCMPYFEQSVYMATATEALVTCIPRNIRPNFGTAYLVGLLNNFGYLVIAEVFNSQFAAICEHIDANPQSSYQAVERHIIGVDRNQLASWLMAYWNMPDSICNALRHQSDPSYEGDDWQYSLLLYLANKLLQERGLLMGVTSDPIPDALFERLKIDRSAAEEAITNLIGASDELKIIAKQMGG
jgi:HD-like signal output (HDOD) protein/prolyl-tRNA editing enzyme YbaK/EbsC (Cys-tRNA(Pro) deacylase)